MNNLSLTYIVEKYRIRVIVFVYYNIETRYKRTKLLRNENMKNVARSIMILFVIVRNKFLIYLKVMQQKIIRDLLYYLITMLNKENTNCSVNFRRLI